MEEPVSCATVTQESSKGTRRQEEAGLAEIRAMSLQCRNSRELCPIFLQASALPDRGGNARRMQAQTPPCVCRRSSKEETGPPETYRVMEQCNRRCCEGDLEQPNWAAASGIRDTGVDTSQPMRKVVKRRAKGQGKVELAAAKKEQGGALANRDGAEETNSQTK
ncbi:UNVERIFIED_CONTAM: hypothetical protein FKN15_022752 [Acipenser sinensis]